ncbi:hypothetical protein [Methylomagnum sp.]
MPEKHKSAHDTKAPVPPNSDAPASSGFTLPDPNKPPAPLPVTPSPTAPGPSVPPPASTVGTAATVPPSETPTGKPSDTSSRDMVIGGAILLVFLIVFFFVKNAWANRLVANRVPPHSANASGWWLFVFLSSLATGAILAGVNSEQFLSPLYLGVFSVIALVGLIGTLLTNRR